MNTNKVNGAKVGSVLRRHNAWRQSRLIGLVQSSPA